MKPRFQGEVMTCIMCGKQQQSDPHKNSDWTCLEVDDQSYYVCPDELPLNDRKANKYDYARAYRLIFEKIGVKP